MQQNLDYAQKRVYTNTFTISSYIERSSHLSLLVLIILFLSLFNFKTLAQNCTGTQTFNSTTFNSATTLTCTTGMTGTKTIYFIGTITINANVDIHDANIIMEDDAIINVISGKTLTLTNCWIHSCDNVHMWDRIKVNSTAKLFAKGSIIEDGKYAFDSDNGGLIYATDGCCFNKDYVGILVENSTLATSPLSIYDCNFSCYVNCSTATVAPILEIISTNLNGALHERTWLGILLQDSKLAAIGNSNFAANQFLEIPCGVGIYNSAANIYNNIFTLMNNTTYFGLNYSEGHGIHIGPATPTTPLLDINIGNSGSSKNTFDHCLKGISADSWYNFNILYNKFNHDGRGININNAPPPIIMPGLTNSIQINYNTFDDCATVGGTYGISVIATKTSVFDIKYNTFNAGTAFSPGIGLTAIKVGNFFNSPTVTNLNIDGNTIYYYRQGIDLVNINFSVDARGSNIVHNNRILYTIPHSLITATPPHFGIRLNKCRNIKVLSNEMSRGLSFGYQDVDAPYISGIILYQFMGTVATIGCPIANNTMYGIPTAIRIQAANPGTKLQCNYMEDSYNGVDLGNATLWATLSNQGTILTPTSNAGWDNNWNYPSSINNIRVVGFSNQFTWYYRNSTAGISNIYYPKKNITQIVLVPNANGQTPCPVTSATQSIVREEELGKIVRDSLTFNDHTTENKWYHNQYAYLSFKENTALLTLHDSDDSLYQAWYNHSAATNIGLFSAIGDSIAAGNFTSAASINASITPANSIETNLQSFNYVLFNFYNNHNVLSADDSATLIYLACQDEFEGGEAVTSAKIILDWNVDTMCGEHDERFSIVEEKPNEIYLYPNPASNIININYPIADSGEKLNVIFFDLTSRKVLDKWVNKTDKINISSLKEGLYFYKITQNGLVIATNKLIVIK